MTLSSGRRANPTAFLGELAAIGRYMVTDNIAVRGGYRLLWIDGVALASDQVSVTAFVPPALAPGRGINSSGDLFFHGAVVGVEAFW